MAENNADKEAMKLAKEAEKAAEKAKKERIKQSKPKKEGNAFSRAGAGIKKFWKDFTGTCKKVVWPSGKQVLKSSLVVLVSIIVVGAVIFGFDTGINALFEQGAKLSSSLGEKAAGDSTTAAETTAADSATDTNGTTAAAQADASDATEAETGAESTAAAEQTTAESTTEA
ncbi:MAG: preprotein translocase subunit SecE [Oscillospiraceae bacterium]|nr:preprotein translocase subunit SecE [Oscillospiraceae bacterium]